MLEKIQDLPKGVFGIRAHGTVSKEDYTEVVIPVLEEARRSGDRIRVLYHFDESFNGFTAAAAWEDMHTGLRYLRRFEKCAVVSDVGWIRRVSRAIAVALPCPVRIYNNAEFNEAAIWLAAPLSTNLNYDIVPDKNVVVVEPRGELGSEDFDALASSVDAWIEGGGGRLEGIVIRADAFPGWQDLGSAISHLSFVKEHHRKVNRIALVTESTPAVVTPTLAQHFVDADVRRFEGDQLKQALSWASGQEKAA